MSWLIQNKEWVFSGLGIVILGFLSKLLINKFKDNSTSKIYFFENYGIAVVGQNGKVIGNNVGNNTSINKDPFVGKIDELIVILELRASLIKKELLQYENTATQIHLDEFVELHNKHIEALKNGNFLAAHIILEQIHQLLHEVYNSKCKNSVLFYRVSYKKEHPNPVYRLSRLFKNKKPDVNKYKYYFEHILQVYDEFIKAPQ